MDEARAQEEINKYKKFKKVDGATYRKVNQFLRKRTYITAREWALARLCTDFRTTNGAEMTFIGEHLPELVPFMEDKYSPQAVNQARNSFKKKVRKSSATFFYGAMCGFFTTEELDDLLFEASEVARFLLEVESTTLDIDEEIDIEDRITGVMRSVGEAAKTILKTRVMDASREQPGAGERAQPSGREPPSGTPEVKTGTQGPARAVRRRRKRAGPPAPDPATEGPEDNTTVPETPAATMTGDTGQHHSAGPSLQTVSSGAVTVPPVPMVPETLQQGDALQEIHPRPEPDPGKYATNEDTT